MHSSCDLTRTVRSYSTFLPRADKRSVVLPNVADFFDQICGACEMFVEPGRMSRIWLGPKPYILVYGAREAEAVFTNQALIDKSDEYRFLHEWLGLGLLTASVNLSSLRIRPVR